MKLRELVKNFSVFHGSGKIQPLMFVGLLSLSVNISLSSISFADHSAILYCEIGAQNDVIVVAADSDPGSGIGTKAKLGKSCSRAIHEIGKAGYEILYIQEHLDKLLIVLEKGDHHDDGHQDKVSLDIN